MLMFLPLHWSISISDSHYISFLVVILFELNILYRRTVSVYLLEFRARLNKRRRWPFNREFDIFYCYSPLVRKVKWHVVGVQLNCLKKTEHRCPTSKSPFTYRVAITSLRVSVTTKCNTCAFLFFFTGLTKSILMVEHRLTLGSTWILQSVWKVKFLTGRHYKSN